MVSAPGGDDESISNNIVADPGSGNGCHDITVGTSFATPVISAVAALMLQANPELGWRDVQGIFATSSQKVDFEDESWAINAAGFSHSYKYGFGLVDAFAAVAYSKGWTSWGPEKQILTESGFIDLVIPDLTESSDGVLATLSVTEASVQEAAGDVNIAMESVVVYLNLGHASRGDLQIILTSPQGTKSILAPGQRPENQLIDEEERWKLMSLRNWGESPVGTWTLELADKKAGLIDECVHFPWQGDLDDVVYNCDDLEGLDCTNPSDVPTELAEFDFNGFTALTACCTCGAGQDALAVEQKLRSWQLITYGHVATDANDQLEVQRQTQAPAPAASNTTQAQTPASGANATLGQTSGSGGENATQAPLIVGTPVNSTCDYENENCPFVFLFDRECNNNLDICATDCFDCDPCQAYSSDCASCVANGCQFCPGDAVCLSTALDDQYWTTYGKTSSCASTSDWVRTCEVSTSSFFKDPLFQSMSWLYQWINVETVWQQDVTGENVHVRVISDGVDAEHPEFSSKFDKENSCVDYLPSNNSHADGTAMASIIGASNNDQCAVGIAPGSSISACRVVPDQNDELEANLYLRKFEVVDIIAIGYGPDTCSYTKGRERNRQLQTNCPFDVQSPLSPCSICGNFVPPLADDCLTAVATYCKIFYENDELSCLEYMDLFTGCGTFLLTHQTGIRHFPMALN